MADNLDLLYDKLSKRENINLPDKTIFKERYGNSEGLDLLYNKMSKMSNINLPEKEVFKQRYLPKVEESSNNTSTILQGAISIAYPMTATAPIWSQIFNTAYKTFQDPTEEESKDSYNKAIDLNDSEGGILTRTLNKILPKKTEEDWSKDFYKTMRSAQDIAYSGYRPSNSYFNTDEEFKDYNTGKTIEALGFKPVEKKDEFNNTYLSFEQNPDYKLTEEQRQSLSDEKDYIAAQYDKKINEIRDSYKLIKNYNPESKLQGIPVVSDLLKSPSYRNLEKAENNEINALQKEKNKVLGYYSNALGEFSSIVDTKDNSGVAPFNPLSSVDIENKDSIIKSFEIANQKIKDYQIPDGEQLYKTLELKDYINKGIALNWYNSPNTQRIKKSLYGEVGVLPNENDLSIEQQQYLFAGINNDRQAISNQINQYIEQKKNIDEQLTKLTDLSNQEGKVLSKEGKQALENYSLLSANLDKNIQSQRDYLKYLDNMQKKFTPAYQEYTSQEEKYKNLSEFYPNTLAIVQGGKDLLDIPKKIAKTGLNLTLDEESYYRRNTKKIEDIKPEYPEAIRLVDDNGDFSFSINTPSLIYNTVKTSGESAILGVGMTGGAALGDATFGRMLTRMGAREVVEVSGAELLTGEGLKGLGKDVLYTLGEKGIKGGKWLTESLVGSVTPSVLMFQDDMLKSEMQKGLTLDQANVTSSLLAAIEGLTEAWHPNEMMFVKELIGKGSIKTLEQLSENEVYKKAIDETIKRYTGKSMSQAFYKNLILGKVFVKGAFNIFKEEGDEEVLGLLLQDLIVNTKGEGYKRDYQGENFTLANVINTYLSTAATMLPMGFTGGNVATREYTTSQKSAQFIVGKNPAPALKATLDLYKDGKISEDEFQRRTNLINKYKDIANIATLANNPDNYTEDQINNLQQSLFNTLIQSYNLESKLSNDLTDEEKFSILEAYDSNTNTLKTLLEKGLFKSDEQRVENTKNSLEVYINPNTLSNVNNINYLKSLSEKLAKYNLAETNESLKSIYNDKISLITKRAEEISKEREKENKTTEEKAAENNNSGSIVIERENGNIPLSYNTPYYISSISEESTTGNKRPIIQILKDNGDGTVIIDSDGEVQTIPISDLSGYKFTRKETVDKWKKDKDPKGFVFEHENDVFEYEFGKSNNDRDKIVRGRITYDQDSKSILFIYKNKKGEVKELTLSKSDLTNQKKFRFVKSLMTEAEYNSQMAKLQENVKNIDENKLQSQSERRIKFILDYINSKEKELQSQKEEIEKVEKQLNEVQSLMEEFQKELNTKETRTKTGRIKLDVKKLISNLKELNKSKEILEKELGKLQLQKGDLEDEIQYVKTEYSDKQFESEKSLIEQLIDDQFNLEIQKEQVGEVITTLEKFIDSIKSIIDSFVENITAILKIAEKLYPGSPISQLELTEYLRTNPAILEENPEYPRFIREFEEILNNNFDKIDVEEKKIENLLKQIKGNREIYQNLSDKIKYQEKLIKAAQTAENSKKSQDKQKKIDTLRDKIFKSQNESQTSIVTNNPNEDEEVVESESPKIELTKLFTATTSGTELKSDKLSKAAIKLQNFLNTVSDITQYSFYVITKDNAKALGLESIIYSDEETTNSTDDENDNDIKLLLIKEIDGALQFIGGNGQHIDLEQLSPDNCLYTSMRKAKLNWSNGEKNYVSKQGLDEEKEKEFAEALRKTYAEARQSTVNTIKSNGTVTLKITGVSRGFINNQDKANKSVVGTILPIDFDLSSKQVIQIPISETPDSVTGKIVYQGTGELINMPIGRPVLSTGQHFVFLKNKQLNQKDRDKVVRIFKYLHDRLVNEGKWDAVAWKYLSKILYVRNPNYISKKTQQVQKENSKYQIWYEATDNTINFGNVKIPFNFSDENVDNLILLDTFLKGEDGNGIYHNVDAKIREKQGKPIAEMMEPFIEVVGVEDGKLITREWKSYQEYLLSDNYNGQKREIDEIPLTTTINPSTEIEPNIVGRYITFENKNNEDVVSSVVLKTIQSKQTSETVQTSTTPAKEINWQPTEFIYIKDIKPSNKRYKASFEKEGFPIEVVFQYRLDGTMYVISNTYPFSSESAPIKNKDIATFYKELISGKSIQKSPMIISIESGGEVRKNTEQLPDNFLEGFGKEEAEENDQPQLTSTTEEIETSDSFFDFINKAQAELNNTKNKKDDDTAYRLAKQKFYVPENLKEAKKWFEERFPQIKFEIIAGLIDNKAWGQVKNGALLLSNIAEEGTVYHEAFEVVYRYFLNPSQLKALKREFRNRKGEFVDRETGKKVQYSKATDHQIKEQLAEEYRDYEISGGKKKWEGEYNKNSLFRRMWDFIHNFILKLSGNYEQIEDVFGKISQAKYKDSIPVSNIEEIDTSYRVAETKKNNIVLFNDAMKSITNLIFESLRQQNRSIPEVITNNFNIEAEYKIAKEKLIGFYGGKEFLDNFKNVSKSKFVSNFSKPTEFVKLVNTFLANDNVPTITINKVRKPVIFYHLELLGRKYGYTSSQIVEKLFDTITNANYIIDNWNDFKEENKIYLSKYGLEFIQEDEDNSPIETEDKDQNEYTGDTLKFSRKLNASTEVKTLIATLRQMERTEKKSLGFTKEYDDVPEVNSLLLSNLVDYGQTIVNLLYKLSPATTFDEMASIIQKEAETNPSLRALVIKLKIGSESTLNEFDVDLRNKFFSSMNSLKAEFEMLLLQDNSNGNSNIVNLSDSRNVGIIKDIWLSNIKSNKIVVKVENGELSLIKSLIPDVNNEQSAIKFLSTLGIDFNISTQKLNSDEKSKFLDAVKELSKIVKSQNPEQIFYNNALTRIPLNTLAELFNKYKESYSEPQHFNIEGEPVQNILLNNFIGTVTKSFNISGNLKDFFNRIPQLNAENQGNGFISNSLILKQGGKFFDKNGNRKKQISVEILDGSKLENSDGGIASSKLTFADRVAQEFGFNLQGIYYLLTPADTKTEWGWNLGHFITQNEANDSSYVLSIMKDYLKAEILTAQQYIKGESPKLEALKKNGDKLRFFENILKSVDKDFILPIDVSKTPEEIVNDYSAKIDEAIGQWLDSNIQSTLEYFLNNGLITNYKPDIQEEGGFISIEDMQKMENSKDKFSILFTPSEFIKNGLTEEEIRDLIAFNTINYTINIFEQHKLLWGDPYQWKDITKRVKSYVSGRRTSVWGANYFNDFNNDKLNKLSFIDSDGNPQNIQLYEGDFGHINYNDSIRKQTFKDVIVESKEAKALSDVLKDIKGVDANAYYEIEEADGQAWSFILGYREIRQRDNTWGDAEEEMFQWDMALCRKDNNLYPEGERGEILRKYDENIISKGNPFLNRSKEGKTLPVFNVLKPIYSGFKDGETATQNLDKMSIAPLTWRLVKGTNAEKFYIEHVFKKTTYITVKSANKVGTLDNIQPLYNENGTVNTSINHEELNFKYFGIQVETKSQKDKSPLGTQLTKIGTINLMVNGIAKSEKAKSLVDRNNKILEAMKIQSRNEIFEEFGIKEIEKDGKKYFEFENIERLEELIQRELNNREAAENIKDALTVVIKDGKQRFELPLDMIIGSEKVEAIFTSIIDRQILRPKLFGGQMPQIASTLFEKGKRKRKNGVLTSNFLKFYENKNGKRYCEVMLPFYMSEYISQGKELDLSQIPDELLFGIGFRIPTQGLNSVEHFKIAGFLPVEYGNSIVVPSEITKKAGSDFDIDKLNIFLYNYYIDRDGKPKKIKFSTSDKELKERYERLHRRYTKALSKLDNIISADYEKNVLFNEVDETTNKLWTAIFGRLNEETLEYSDADIQDILEENESSLQSYNRIKELAKREQEGITIDDFKKLPIELQNSRKALENHYIDTLREILELPENFAQLIKPNSVEVLQQEAKESNELWDILNESKGIEKYLDRLNNAKTRQSFLVGKEGVGIGAVNQTSHSIAQQIGLSFEADRVKFNIHFDTNSEDLGNDNKKYLLGMEFAKDGNSISSIIEAFTNGFVDIAKDPFIADINGNLTTAGIYLTGVRMGIPIKMLRLWFTQPVIKDYIKYLQNNKSISINLTTGKLKRNEIIERLSAKYGFDIGKAKRNENYTTNELESYIKEYVEKQRTKEPYSGVFKDEQGILLDEFIKLEALSWELFRFYQGVSYDTTRTVSFDSIRIKFYKTLVAYNGIFGKYVPEVFNKTFVGAIVKSKFDILQAIRPLYITENQAVRSILNPILENVFNQKISISQMEEMAKDIRKQLITYLLQTIPVEINGKKALLTSSIEELFKSNKGISRQLRDIQEKEQKGILNQNFLTKHLLGVPKPLLKSEADINNIRLIRKPSDKIDSDLYTADFRNLFNYPETEKFAYDLIKTALLQSGIRVTPISFSELIPNDIFKNIVKQIEDYVNSPEILEKLKNFENSFYENSWKDGGIIPRTKAKNSEGKSRIGAFLKKVPIPMLRFGVMKLGEPNTYISREIGSKYLLHTTLKITGYTDKMEPIFISKRVAEEIKRKGGSPFEETLYKRLEITNPITGKIDVPLAKKNYGDKFGTWFYVLYYPVSKKGDGFNLTEHYDEPQNSQVNPPMPKITPERLVQRLEDESLMSDLFLNGDLLSLQDNPNMEDQMNNLLSSENEPVQISEMSLNDTDNQLITNLIEYQETEEDIKNSTEFKNWLAENNDPLLTDDENFQYYLKCIRGK